MALEIDAYLCTLSRSPSPIQNLALKIGGTPVFTHDQPWPVCKHCGVPMDFLAQIPLDSPLVFSSRYRMAYLFMCPGKFDSRGWLECMTWDPKSGANQVLLQGDTGSLVIPVRPPRYPDYAIIFHHALEPLIDVSDFDNDDALQERVSMCTKLGGVPFWLQTSETPACPICGGETKFVAQFDATLGGPLPAYTELWRDDLYQFFDFGDVGLGYLFLCSAECCPQGAAFLWQST